VREIKFRAWDKEEGNFIYFNAINGLLSECDKTYMRRNVWRIDQYTGLHDRNGVEIYEGDVLKVTDINGDPDRNCIVEWSEIGAGYPYEPYDGYGDFDISTIGWAMELEFTFEVIGNIYENPELCNIVQG